MTDLIDRISGDAVNRPKINTHKLIGIYDLYVLGSFTRTQLADEFDITGNVDEARQAGQIADNIDAQLAGVSYTISAGNVTWTNQPLALTELFGNVHRRQVLNFRFNDQIRLAARVSTAGVAAALIFAQYSTNESVWSTLTNSIALTPTGTKVSTWVAIPSGAKVDDVFVRIVGQGGDGAADPILGNILLQASVPWDKASYLHRVNGVFMAIEDQNDRLFHDINGVINKVAVYAALQIAG